MNRKENAMSTDMSTDTATSFCINLWPNHLHKLILGIPICGPWHVITPVVGVKQPNSIKLVLLQKNKV